MKAGWKYCECGCHGYELSIGKLYFWMIYDLKETFHLYKDGHGFMGTDIGKFASMAAADQTARMVARSEICKMQAEI